MRPGFTPSPISNGNRPKNISNFSAQLVLVKYNMVFRIIIAAQMYSGGNPVKNPRAPSGATRGVCWYVWVGGSPRDPV